MNNIPMRNNVENEKKTREKFSEELKTAKYYICSFVSFVDRKVRRCTS